MFPDFPTFLKGVSPVTSAPVNYLYMSLDQLVMLPGLANETEGGGEGEGLAEGR